MVIYEGIFFDDEVAELIYSLDEKKLDELIKNIHCTFKFRPQYQEIFDDIVGKEFTVLLIGYGNDGANSGFQIQLPEELHPYYINYENNNPQIWKVPHITSSIAYGAKPINTKNLTFKALDKPIRIKGRFGYWVKDDMGEHISFKPWKKSY